MVENLSVGVSNSSQNWSLFFFGTDRTSAEPVEDTETTAFVAEFVSAFFFFFIPLFLSMCLSLSYCLASLLYSLFCADLKLFNLFKLENRSYRNLPRNVTTSKHNVQWGLVPKGPLKSMLWQAPSRCAQQSHSLLRMIKKTERKENGLLCRRTSFSEVYYLFIFS